MFVPDTLTHAEYYEVFRIETSMEPEKKLMLAVLKEAVSCFQTYLFARDEEGKIIFRQAEDWIFEEHSRWLYSFETICDVLGLDSGYIRRKLLRWKEIKLARRLRSKIYPTASVVSPTLLYIWRLWS